MQAQMVTGFFRYEPCELYVKNKELCVNLLKEGHQICISGIKDVILCRMKNGAGRLELSTGTEQYEFVLSDVRSVGIVTEMMYDLTKDSVRLELRTQDT